MKLEDRIKSYETLATQGYLLPRIPIVARIDFRGFSKFTKSLAKPYDERLSNLMIETTKYLVEKNDPLISYTQSDEITLVFKYDTVEDMPFRGRIFKITSLLAAQASGFFNKKMSEYLPEKNNIIVECDCRPFNVPTDMEAYNALLLRERDATKNAISMAADAYYSHKELKGKNGNEKQEMLFQKGVNFNDYPSMFKRGSYIKKVKIELEYTEAQLAKMKKKPESKTYIRNRIDRLKLEPIVTIQSEMLEIIFGNDGE